MNIPSDLDSYVEWAVTVCSFQTFVLEKVGKQEVISLDLQEHFPKTSKKMFLVSNLCFVFAKLQLASLLL